MVLKRKISAHLVCIEPKKTNNLPKKPPTKADILKEFKIIQKLNEALEEENKKNLDTIVILERKIQFLQTKKSESSLKSSDSQTSTDVVQIPCNICIFVATCEEQLNWHMGEDHDLPTDSYFETDYACDICGKWCRSASDLILHQKKHEIITIDKVISCNICEEKFETIGKMMIHKKGQHTEKVSTCWKYADGKCELGDNLCWFVHSEASNESDFPGIQCNTCEKAFHSQDALMKHKKAEHVTTVKPCKNAFNNTCWYGDQKCWFRHDLLANNENIECSKNSELTDKIFKMMGKCTHRSIEIENHIRTS